jgi:hypothetical protein
MVIGSSLMQSLFVALRNDDLCHGVLVYITHSRYPDLNVP